MATAENDQTKAFTLRPARNLLNYYDEVALRYSSFCIRRRLKPNMSAQQVMLHRLRKLELQRPAAVSSSAMAEPTAAKKETIGITVRGEVALIRFYETTATRANAIQVANGGRANISYQRVMIAWLACLPAYQVRMKRERGAARA